MTKPASDAQPCHVLILYGTRPEAIKLAPVVRELRRRREAFEITLGATGQHREMLAQVQEVFDLVPDRDLALMRPDQTLNTLTSRAFAGIDRLLEEVRPEWVLVQGDTTSAMASALAAFHRGIRVGHVEAGLRTGDLQQPFPEEANRRIIDTVADALYAPTAKAREQLIREGADPNRILVTGNTVVDSLESISARLGPADEGEPPSVLLTVHRRESFGKPLNRILSAIRDLSSKFPDHRWVFPVHPNPSVRTPALRLLGDRSNVEVCAPFDYLELVRRLRSCRIVLTDSGGLQEEAPTFGKPVLVLRERTERSEGLESGVARLVGTDPECIVDETTLLLTDYAAYRRMAQGANPYGDGRAAERIAEHLAGEDVAPFEPATRNAQTGPSVKAPATRTT